MAETTFTPLISEAFGMLHRDGLRFDPRFYTLQDSTAATARIATLYLKQPLGDKGITLHTHIVDLRDVFNAEQLASGARMTPRFVSLLDQILEMDHRGQHKLVVITHEGGLSSAAMRAIQSTIELEPYHPKRVLSEVDDLMTHLRSPFTKREGERGPVHFLPAERRPWGAPLPEVKPTHILGTVAIGTLLEYVAHMPHAAQVYRKADQLHRLLTGAWRFLHWPEGKTSPLVGYPGAQLPLECESSSLKSLVYLSLFLAYVDETAEPGAIVEIPPILEGLDAIRRHAVVTTLVSFAATTRFGLVLRYASDSLVNLPKHLFSSLTAYRPYEA